jgi:hypothetical protein
MPIFVKEIILGSSATLAQQSKMAENNNKYKNLLLLREDEHQVYLCPSSVTSQS